jgi:tetratricopeptide (TPR) repeat protein
MIRSLIDDQVIVQSENQWQIHTDQIHQPIIGTTLVDIILRRISHLSEQCNRVLTTASCIGRSFSLDVLVRIDETSVEQIDKSIEEGLLSRLILRQPGPQGEQFMFAHDKIHETFYQNIQDNRKRDLHLRIAQAIEKDQKGDPGKAVYALAFHFAQGGEIAKAFDYSFKAGISSFQALAMHQASKFFETALSLHSRLGLPAPLELEIRERLADASTIVGDYERAIENYKNIMPRIQDKTHQGKLEGKIGAVHLRKGEMTTAIEHFTAGLKYFRKGIARTRIGSIATILWFLGRFTFGSLIPGSIRRKRYGSNIDRLKEIISLYQHSTLSLFWVDFLQSFECYLKNRVYAGIYGNSPELARALNESAIAWTATLLKRPALFALRKSKRMCIDLNDQLALAENHYYHGLVLQWDG